MHTAASYVQVQKTVSVSDGGGFYMYSCVCETKWIIQYRWVLKKVYYISYIVISKIPSPVTFIFVGIDKSNAV